MSNENEEPGLDFIHGSCEDKNIDGEDGDVGYYSQESSDTPPSPIDCEIPTPFQEHSHFEQSQFEDEEPHDEFYYNDEYAIDDITKGIAFVLVHEKPIEKIGSANIRNIVEAGKINYCKDNVDFDIFFSVRELTQMMRNDMTEHFENFEKK